MLGPNIKRNTSSLNSSVSLHYLAAACKDHQPYRFRWTESLKKYSKKGLKKVTELKNITELKKSTQKALKLKKVLKKVNSLKQVMK